MLWNYVHQVENCLLKPRGSLTCLHFNKIHPRTLFYFNYTSKLVKFNFKDHLIISILCKSLRGTFYLRILQIIIVDIVLFKLYFSLRKWILPVLEGSSSSFEIVESYMIIIWYWKWQPLATTHTLWKAFSL